tara:strand:- start:443 stop:856 length:414 start_codon:yes stop_codon:yes gene_type:complete
MFDHMIAAPSRADAMAALSHLTVEVEGETLWSAPVFDAEGRGLSLIVSEQPDGSSRVVVPGYWAIVALPDIDEAVKASSVCRLISSRALRDQHEDSVKAGGDPVPYLVHFAPDFDPATFASVLYFSPQIAGANYILD